MADMRRFCQDCGSIMMEDERFCGNCGRPANNSPDGDNTGRSKKLTAVVLGVAGLLLIALTAYIIWAYASIKSPKAPISGGDAPGKPSTAQTKPNNAAAVKIEDYVGSWLLAADSGGNGNTIVLKQNGGQIQGTLVNSPDSKMDLGPSGQSQLKGTITAPGQPAIPMTAELSADKNKLILTLAPPQSEYVVSVAIRQDSAVGSGGAGAAAPSSPRVNKITAGLGLDQQQRVNNPANVFRPDTPEVFISVEVGNVSSETAVDITWVYLGTNDSIKGPTQIIKADAYTGFSLTRPTQGWPVGQYRSIVYLNGVEAGNISFSVK